MITIHADATPEMTEREKKNMQLCREIAAEGMVLLENNGLLPMQLKGKKIALFGGARRTIKGGKGSGSVNSRMSINVERGLEEAGAIITTKSWLDRLDAHVEAVRQVFTNDMKQMIKDGANPIMVLMGHPFIEPASVPILPEDLESPADAAIYVISRNAGEGADRRMEEYLLHDEEKEALRLLCRTYRHVVVLLNVGASIDTSFLRSLQGIDAVLLMSQGGNIGGQAVCDVLSGKVTPSGHLTATWAERYGDHPTSETFSYRNNNTDDEYYHEGIYVGYRYFDTFGVKPAHPFGYGLSYTTFSTTVESVRAEKQQIHVTARVANTGSYSGKEVVQVYVSAPKGRIPKAYQQLVAFGKTECLAPGASHTMTITFPTEALTSFDEANSCWVAEAGDYVLRVGCHSRATHVAAVLRVTKTAVTEHVHDCLKPDVAFDLLNDEHAAPFTYAEEEKEINDAAVIHLQADDFPVHKPAKTETVTFPNVVKEGISMQDVLEGHASAEELIAQLTVPELASLCVGAFRHGAVDTGAFGANAVTCPGAAGETNFKLRKSHGVPTILLADGPAGLRLDSKFKTDAEGNLLPTESDLCQTLFGISMSAPKTVQPEPEGTRTWYQYCTAIPIATMLAQTWNMDALRAIGDMVGGEMAHFGISLWLAPGMNIQRDPLCGRNFEYYSEDPLLAGLCAAQVTKGVQAHSGCGTTIKHFACNNQEDNRMHTNAHVPVQALREIYLRGFEMAVKLAQPKAIMSSYNLLNGIHTANHRELLTTVAREEWGFEGLIMTDWSTTRTLYDDPSHKIRYGCSSAPGCIHAGNDLIMPGMPMDETDIVAAVEDRSLPIDELRACANRVLKAVANGITAVEN